MGEEVKEVVEGEEGEEQEVTAATLHYAGTCWRQQRGVKILKLSLILLKAAWEKNNICRL